MAVHQYIVTYVEIKKIAFFSDLVSQKLSRSITLSFPTGGGSGATI